MMFRNIRTLITLIVAIVFSGCGGDDTSSTTSFDRGVNINHWLSQNYGKLTYGADWFDREDVEWIASQGFDHIRIPIDYKEWVSPEGELIDEALEPFDNACSWAQEFGLGVILDMHYLPGAAFTNVDSSLFTDPALLQEASAIWDLVAQRYAEAGPWLRFELINEPVADRNAQLNPVLNELLRVVRRTNPERVVYITSNRWGKFYTVPELEIPDDPNIALTVHFYDPFPFTHQSTAWTDLKPPMPQIDFPGLCPDLSDIIPESHSWMRFSGAELTAESHIDPHFDQLKKWQEENAPNLEIHIGEFGAFNTASPASIENYCEAVVSAAERHGFGWAIWGYTGGFGVVDSKGSPTPVMNGLVSGAADDNFGSGK